MIPAEERKPRGPALLVQTFIFSQDHILLMRRGIPPYVGKWSPPGGFVEPFESTEAAAIRETREEVGIQIDIERLLPLATASIDSMNQVYIMYIVRLDQLLPPHACEPEATDARWFHESEFPLVDLWEPIARFNMSELFERVRAGRFEFYQRTDDFHRVISEREQIRYFRQHSLRSPDDE